MAKVVLFSIIMFFGYTLSAQISPLYIGSYTANGSKGVHVYDFDERDGKATFKRVIEASNPSFLARKNNILYLVNENGEGSLGAYDLVSNRFLETVPTHGAHPCHVSLSPVDPIVVVSNYSGGSLVLYSLDADGSLAKKEDFIQFKASSVNKARQSNSHIHSAFFTDDGRYLFVSDLGGDLVYQFEVKNDNQSGYNLSLVDEIKIKSGGGPRHVVIGKDAKKLYVVLELTGEIEVFEFVNSKWVSRQVVPIFHEGFVGEHGAADIKLSKDGKYIYATNRLDVNEIAVYKVLRDGQLDLVQILSVGGDSPRNVQISPNEKWVLISNQKSGTVQVFERNRRNGKLKITEEVLSVPSAVCSIF